MVFDWMITVVSPRWMLLDVVVIVRVTLQAVNTVARPMITRATIVVIIFRIKDFMIGRSVSDSRLLLPPISQSWLMHSIRGGAIDGYRVRLTLRLIVGFTADLPQIGLEGFFAVRGILLCRERGVISLIGAHVLCTSCHGATYCRESCADSQFVSRDRRGALVGVLVLYVEALAFGIFGRCGTVRHDDVVAVRVSVFLDWSFDCALDVLDTTGANFCFTHIVFGNGSHGLSVPRSSRLPMPPLFDPQTLRWFVSRERKAPPCRLGGVKVG